MALAVVLAGIATAWWITRDDEEATPPATTAVTVPPTTAPAPATTVTTAPPTTEPEATTTEPPPPTEPVATVAPLPAPEVPPGAVVVADPAGWTIAIDPGWTETPLAGARSWVINAGSATFDDNLNVTTEALPGPLTLDQYVEAALAAVRAGAPDVEVTDVRRYVAADGAEHALVTWSGTLPGAPRLVFVQALTVSATAAYVATFTTEPDRAPLLAIVLEPYLLSLRGS